MSIKSCSKSTVGQVTNTDELVALAHAHIAEFGVTLIIGEGRRSLRSRMPASYDPQATFRAVDKRNPHVCARWSDN
tara:strand:- start:342 stop:569 length:228 start_codon:yes stop_codon:yes gene_type:complete